MGPASKGKAGEKERRGRGEKGKGEEEGK